MSASTNNTPTKNSTSLSTKMKGGAKVATGLGNTVRGTTFGAIDSVENRDSSTNDEIARRGRMEIEEGIAMIKGRPATSASTAMGPSNSLQGNLTRLFSSLPEGWGSGINGANADATTNATGFPPPRGQEYAQSACLFFSCRHPIITRTLTAVDHGNRLHHRT
ncbi:hypothetical protein C8F01DRAFT_1145072 [Mycena amicta]|nr:hypothetical protein C8F01DRAFT_1145072 [Mycena amicta]